MNIIALNVDVQLQKTNQKKRTAVRRRDHGNINSWLGHAPLRALPPPTVTFGPSVELSDFFGMRN